MKRTKVLPHPIQAALWNEFHDVNPGVTVHPFAEDEGKKGPQIDVLVSGLSLVEARELLVAARAIVQARSKS